MFKGLVRFLKAAVSAPVDETLGVTTQIQEALDEGCLSMAENLVAQHPGAATSHQLAAIKRLQENQKGVEK